MTHPMHRFASKVRVDAGAGCWLWTAAKNKDGYGSFWGGEHRPDGSPIMVLAHRWSYEHHVGPVPPGAYILHSCDTPACVNPEHLRIGTQADNVRDCAARGRRNQARFRKLTPAIHAEIRRRYAEGGISQSALAGEYGVAQPTISSIIRR